MGTVYRKTATKPLPAGAEIFTRQGQRRARWRNAKGRTRTEPLTIGADGQERIVVTARTYTAKYRDGSKMVREVATGCRDETAARSILADLERRAELVKGKVLTVAEGAVADHNSLPIAEHFAAYLISLESQGVSPVHCDNVRRCLDRIAADCSFSTLATFNRDALEGWLVQRAKDKMGARTRNAYRAAMVAFCNWCISTHRLIANPFAKVAKADEVTDRRRLRRAMTEAELRQLLDVARRRPLLDALTVRRGDRKGEAIAKLRPEVVERLERLGRERALIYKTLVLTGLRKGELTSLTLGQLHLEGEYPYAELAAADEKNREGSQIPLRCDLAADLASWVADLQSRNASDSGANYGQVCLPMTGVSQSGGLPADTPLFNVPKGLIRILDRDLKLAGIPKRDERGRTIDVHALRHTFGTHLSKGNVMPRTAQAAMRHSTIDLTMNVYTDPKLLDVHGALDALPALDLDDSRAEQMSARATGTDDSRPRKFAPAFAPTTDDSCKSWSIPVKTAGDAERDARRGDGNVKSFADKRNHPQSIVDYGCTRKRAKGLEPSTSSLGS